MVPIDNARKPKEIELPDSITLEDDEPGRGLRLEKRESEKGVIVYSKKIDWRDPDKELDDN